MKHVSLQIIEQTFFCHNNYVFIIGLSYLKMLGLLSEKFFISLVDEISRLQATTD